MGTRTLFSAVVLGVALGVAGARAQQPPAQPPQTPAPAAPAAAAAPAAQEPAASPAPGYAWADACKSCHTEIYDAWSKTRHAKALELLSGGDQEKECVGCHVTGPKSKILDGKKVLNAGVQCESCHGPSAAHAAEPTVRTGLGKKPSEAGCVECHSAKSPHFRGFYFSAMAPIVHKVTK